MLPTIRSSFNVKMLAPFLTTAIGGTYNSPYAIFSRKKSGRKKENQQKNEDTDDDSDSDSDEPVVAGKGTEIKTSYVSSMRVDLMLKNGLGIARNKIEEAFYESKIRLNSKKIIKKSHQVRVGDEVDLIKGVSPSNPLFIVVGRIEILGAKPRPDTEDIQVKIRRSKSLVIENYPDGDPWKHSEQQS